jgi:hypothetical protein
MFYFCFCCQFKYVFRLYPSLLTKGIHHFYSRCWQCEFSVRFCHVHVLDLPHLKLSIDSYAAPLNLRDRSLNMARGGDGGETRNFEKNFGAPLKNYMPFQGPPLMHFILFKDPPSCTAWKYSFVLMAGPIRTKLRRASDQWRVLRGIKFDETS